MSLARAAVVDASVAAKLFLPEELDEKARRLFARLTPHGAFSIVAPDLLYVECAQIFWKRVAFRDMAREEARHAMGTLLAFPIAAVPTSQLALPALDLASALGITVYDACYAALAVEMGFPLVTADKRLVRRLAKGLVKAVWLGDCD